MKKWQRHPRQKLSEAEVTRILYVVDNKIESQSAMAKEYNVSRQLISLIVNGKAWKHITKDRRKE